MAGSAGNYLIFNGEIYNYRELKADLESLGERFRTTGDTEVLLHALERWGEDALTRLEGMFGFLFWNARQKQALLARDPLGIKPLYYWLPPTGGLCAASEIKAFYALRDFQPQFRTDALAEYVRFRCLIGSDTLLKGVAQVQPGELLRFDSGSRRLTSRNYWQVAADPAAVPANSEVLDALQNMFRATVERHLLSDVPVGAQLSGGVDSSLSLGVACKDLGRNIKGFHCSVQSEAVNETGYAQSVADCLGVSMESVSLTGREFFSSMLDRLTWHMDEPLGHPNALGVHLVSALARPQVTVLISGEGADEVFAGYPRYTALLRNHSVRQVPGLSSLLRRLPALDIKYYRALRKSAHWAGQPFEEEIAVGMQFVAPELVVQLFGPAAAARTHEPRLELLRSIQAADLLTRCQIFDLATYLPALLVRQDKMSMAASIENRVPFVTTKMVGFGLALPAKCRAAAGEQKIILKQLLTRYIPRALVYRRKAGFTIPVSEWLQTSSGRERLQWLLEPSCPVHSLFDSSAVRDLVHGYKGDAEPTEAIWVLLTSAIWARIFGNKTAVLERASAAIGRC